METVYRLPKIRQHWHALHFNLSQLTPEMLPADHLTQASSTITSLLMVDEQKPAQENETLFICLDEDIFVLCNERTEDEINAVASALRELFSEDPMLRAEKPESPFFAQYDLSTQHEAFYYVCSQKRLTARQLRLRQGATPSQVEPERIANARRMRDQRDGVLALLVEDDTFSASLVSTILRPQHELTVVHNAVDALRHYEATAPDIVFLDIGLPGLNGLDVLRELIANDPDAFVVMLTAHGYLDMVKNAMEMGAKGFISKPFNKMTLDGYVGRCISDRTMRRFRNPRPVIITD